MTRSDVALAMSNLLLGTAVGAGINQSIFVMPRWFASPPESLRLVRDRNPGKFWIPLQAGAAVALGAALALNRRNASRARLLKMAVGCYVATWVSTAAYFAPEIIRLSRADGELPASEITRRGKRWMNLTWLRHGALAAAWALTVPALAGRQPTLSLGRLRA